MPTYRKQEGGHALANGNCLEEGWGIFQLQTPGEDYDLPAGEEPWAEELIAVVDTETMADTLLAAMQPRTTVPLAGGVFRQLDSPPQELVDKFLADDYDIKHDWFMVVYEYPGEKDAGQPVMHTMPMLLTTNEELAAAAMDHVADNALNPPGHAAFFEVCELLGDAPKHSSKMRDYLAKAKEQIAKLKQPEAVTQTAEFWRQHARNEKDPWPTRFFNLEQAYNHATGAYWAYKERLTKVISLVQRYQPPGSPIPGDEYVLAAWVLAELNKRPVPAERLNVGDKFHKVNEQDDFTWVVRRKTEHHVVFTAEAGCVEFAVGLGHYVMPITETTVSETPRGKEEAT